MHPHGLPWLPPVQALVDNLMAARSPLFGDPGQFQDLLEEVQHQFPDAAAAAPESLRIAVAACWLGPGTQQPPPPDALAAVEVLLGLWPAAATPGTLHGFLIQVVAAYGAGWHRHPPPAAGPNSWDGVWPNAVQALARGLKPAVIHANQDVRARSADAWPAVTNLDGRTLADEIARHLTYPIGSVHRASGRVATFECARDLVGWAETHECWTSLGWPPRVRPAGTKTVWEIASHRAEINRVSARAAEATPAPVPSATPVVVGAHDRSTTIHAAAEGAVLSLALDLGEAAELSLPGTASTLSFWACTCGWQKCGDRHRIASWNAALTWHDRGGVRHVSLWSFLASAVKGSSVVAGSARRTIQPTAFGQSMLYPLLAEGWFGPALLRVMPVETSGPRGARVSAGFAVIDGAAVLLERRRALRLHCPSKRCGAIYALPAHAATGVPWGGDPSDFQVWGVLQSLRLLRRKAGLRELMERVCGRRGQGLQVIRHPSTLSRLLEILEHLTAAERTLLAKDTRFSTFILLAASEQVRAVLSPDLLDHVTEDEGHHVAGRELDELLADEPCTRCLVRFYRRLAPGSSDHPILQVLERVAATAGPPEHGWITSLAMEALDQFRCPACRAEPPPRPLVVWGQ